MPRRPRCWVWDSAHPCPCGMGGLSFPGMQDLSMLEAGNRAVLIWLNKSPQFAPITDPFFRQIPPLEGDWSETFRYNELTLFPNWQWCHRSGRRAGSKFCDNICSSSTNAAFTGPWRHFLLNTCPDLCPCCSSLFAGVPPCLQAQPSKLEAGKLLQCWGPALLSPPGAGHPFRAARGQAEQALPR